MGWQGSSEGTFWVWNPAQVLVGAPACILQLKVQVVDVAHPESKHMWNREGVRKVLLEPRCVQALVSDTVPTNNESARARL